MNDSDDIKSAVKLYKRGKKKTTGFFSFASTAWFLYVPDKCEQNRQNITKQILGEHFYTR